MVDFYDEQTVFVNCTIQVLRNSKTGRESVGWYRGNELIHCGQCKYYDEWGGICKRMERAAFVPSDYCSFAERRMEE